MKLHRNVIENGDLTQTTPHEIQNDLSSFPDEYQLVIMPSTDAEGQDGIASISINGIISIETNANEKISCESDMTFIHFGNQVMITRDTYQRVTKVETMGWAKGTFNIIIARIYPE